ncbi:MULTISPECIES: GNAT family N-acetyltransferase [unclassified Arthrobacter]|uniref:GNAT family N-acetyltransferase n=1 Tax=unclassified Arthrobacter TaxID=235627 RepID=UPI0027D7C91C|nr:MULTISPECIES: GNAT family N-acetyltransferase [unclassified Arthrobacter]
MNPLITLAALTGPHDGPATSIPVRTIEARDLPELTRMYRHAYADGPLPSDGGSPEWIRALFDGVHGRLVTEASLVTTRTDGSLTAAIITTDSAPGSERGGPAFIAELITRPEHRRQGLAEELLRHCMHALHSMGRSTVAVSVDSRNAAAIALYLSRDFRRLTDDSDTDGDTD